MPLTIDASNLSKTNGWTKSSSYFFYYPNGVKDGDNHIHVATQNGSADPLEIKYISIKVDGTSTNLRVGTARNGFKFKEASDTVWPDDDDTTERYKTALRDAELMD